MPSPSNFAIGWVAKKIEPLAKPKDIRFGDKLPKTRRRKTLRRLLCLIAADIPVTQNLSTLENPSVLNQLGERY